MKAILIILLILTSACNKEKIDLVDIQSPFVNTDTLLNTNNNINISIGKPKYLRETHFVNGDTSYSIQFEFKYLEFTSILYNISVVDYVDFIACDFNYSNNTVEVDINNNGTKWHYKALINDHGYIDQLILLNDTTYFRYDSNWNITEQWCKRYSYTKRTYENGNLIESKTKSYMDPNLDAVVQYEYYDSLEISSSKGYFPFTGYDVDMGNQFTNVHMMGYLDLFGIGNRNLIKSTKTFNIFEIKTDYFWEIKNNRIIKLTTINDQNLKTIVDYFY